MKIINNNDQADCHFSNLVELIENAEELLIVSPFISSNYNIIPPKYLKRIKKLTLLTTLPKLCSEQEKKVGFFLHYLDLASRYGFDLTLFIDDSLHGKVYISKTAGQCKAIITSANFTNNGLRVNNEWGIYLDDTAIVSDIWRTITTSPKIYELTPKMVREYQQIINSGKIAPQKGKAESYPFQPPVSPTLSNPPKNFTCWLKPIGTQTHPIPDTELHDTPKRELTFAVKPVGIKTGDIVICYAAVRKYIVSVYIVEKEWFVNNHSKDFPYSISGKNLYPYYGGNWPKKGFTIDTMKAKFTAKTQFTITPKGANNYKRLTQADKMKVTAEYATFVMQELDNVNKELASQNITD